MNKDAIDTVLSSEQLRAFNSSLSGHSEDNRMKQLMQHIFTRDGLATTECKKKAMDLNMKAIEAAITLGCYSNYSSENGTLDWAAYQQDLMKATGMCAHVERDADARVPIHTRRMCRKCATMKRRTVPFSRVRKGQ